MNTVLKFKVGDKFKDDFERILEVAEIDVDSEFPYIMSIEEGNRSFSSSYSQEELEKMEQLPDFNNLQKVYNYVESKIDTVYYFKDLRDFINYYNKEVNANLIGLDACKQHFKKITGFDFELNNDAFIVYEKDNQFKLLQSLNKEDVDDFIRSLI